MTEIPIVIARFVAAFCSMPYSNRVTCGTIIIRVLAIGMLTTAMTGPLRAVEGQSGITFAENRIGMPPEDYGSGATASRQVGKWTIVRDRTASQGTALEQNGGDATRR